ncbi:16S rRNA (cytosine(1402)-N(4))-methyltransferase RsmH [Serpentinicella alkaliphila]|uniref:Ribosomal RNA small subunit methyltransferase H n=1 Tax=Serpentinicella alkaliphila TaxID=1734049 RepID=A0A4R2TVI4_9FIRM|nr:16S rRNA (cytosine(1402)-N(4))-methyltransferase RsmH [Serpentinicella alkaliphila]QUH26777.1 16S rRNA (cytosine(1402)-N(4))-methyltransferase RsmH [Serpentinicella alkaliphila]TCQ07998.1 16S rRNA (cytosine1402-N4)-methyltransferase [Serpentinicella alkaliphila]
MEFKHVSIMLEECIENLKIKEDGIYVDGTLGGAGHSKDIAKRLNENGMLIGIDQDINAIRAAEKRLEELKCKIKLVHDNFSNLENILQNINVDKIDGILLDLGVSSPQLDEAERGFAYMQNGILDMRMDERGPITAKDIVNNYTEQQLTDIFWKYGEEKWAKRIAEFIIQERQEKEITTTFELVDVIKKAIPKKARMEGSHPAKKVFQAIRIEVNNELGIIENTIVSATEKLNVGGRICIITFHSLEDRIVKNTFKELSDPCICPPQFPICTCNRISKLKVITKKPIVPTDEEYESNSRSKSSKLRVAERI